MGFRTSPSGKNLIYIVTACGVCAQTVQLEAVVSNYSIGNWDIFILVQIIPKFKHQKTDAKVHNRVPKRVFYPLSFIIQVLKPLFWVECFPYLILRNPQNCKIILTWSNLSFFIGSACRTSLTRETLIWSQLKFVACRYICNSPTYELNNRHVPSYMEQVIQELNS